jgi:protein gp37
MGTKSKIEWLDGGATWNYQYGCSKIAPGCRECYGERVLPRLATRAVGPILPRMETSGAATMRGTVILREDHLDDPLRWTKARSVFVNSLSDTFHENVPVSLIDRAIQVTYQTPQHRYLFLTKRPARMEAYVARRWGVLDAIPKNLWWGASASDQATFDDTVTRLGLVRAHERNRFLSLEPLIGPIAIPPELLRSAGIGWVIVGGESGRLARPCEEKWVRDIVRACRAAGVPVYVKQMGAAWAKEVRLASGPNRMETKGNQPYLWPKDIQVREVP